VPAQPLAYRPRDGAAGVLHAVVRDHLEEFLQLAIPRDARRGARP